MATESKPTKRRFACAVCWTTLFTVALIVGIVIAVYATRFSEDTPVAYADPVEHFKYGSTGGEREMGFPLWIFKVLPQVCSEHLPGEGFQSLGLVFEEGRDLPVGMSQRRHLGIDRVFLNCAVCHTSTVKVADDKPPVVVAGMPAHRFDILAFQKFFFECGTSASFTPKTVVAHAEAAGADLDLMERYLVYPLAVYIMRERLLSLRKRFEYIYHTPEWGPGRVDTWNSAKAGLNFPYSMLTEREKVGMSDFPSIWNQRQREGMQLHWTGNNTSVEERNRSAALGTGATPPTLDRQSIKRMEDWLLDARPPKYADFFPVNAELAARGEPIYQRYCSSCHGKSGTNFTGDRVGKVMPIADIGTDRNHLDSYTHTLAVGQNTFYAGYEGERFENFRKTFGYANMPLDGIWLRAPYLHNGSVPHLRALLEPANRRPRTFYRGSDRYDTKNVGFESDVAKGEHGEYFLFDVSGRGNSNDGHEGPEYGTDLPTADKEALLEFLKTL